MEKAGIFGGILMLGVALALLALMIVTMWRLFEKAGRAGWKCIIPIYNAVVLCQIGNVSPWILLLSLGTLIPIVGFIAGLVMNLIIYQGVSQVFNKGVGFTIGLLLLPFIFFPILAFGDSVYENPEDF